ncbi:hypothetical protein I4641_21205 [Waterburya agarophytonicola K14]|uniref:NACHT N-terminal Helical domain-containing protein n=1 Tax=Waterburya agarophytonicola KI4 TaxID=2874699 RepID=A0A964BVJ5_9CYAN|nr:hypothetical protein [Waterburya agarophytonicola]MCC0179481.1 hypothetical protein [Waterburya agarophytonicola KI4]
MMVEPITLISTWGLSTGAKFVYDKIIDELKKDTTKEWAKDVLQDWLKDVFKEQASEKTGFVWDKAVKFLTAEPLEKAAETALIGFLALIDKHLAKDLELSEEQRERFQKPLTSFLKEPSVRQVLGTPFKVNSDYLDIKALKETWDDLGLRDLPNNFNWDKLGKDYLDLVKKTFDESAELKPLLQQFSF